MVDDLTHSEPKLMRIGKLVFAVWIRLVERTQHINKKDVIDALQKGSLPALFEEKVREQYDFLPTNERRIPSCDHGTWLS
jgi:hypothetical protein